MTMLPMNNQSAILSGGYSPWQAPLAALFSGISAAAQPGGFANFGMGVQQGQQNFQQGQQAQQMMDLRRMQIEQAQEEQRRANQEAAQEQAKQDALRNFFATQQPGSPAPMQAGGPGGIQTSPATGGIQTASGAPGGQFAAMFGGDQQKAALFSKYADLYPEEAFGMMVQAGFAEPKDNSTDDQREYQMAVEQGYQGSFFDYLTDLKKAGAAAGSTTTIYNKDYGSIPPGHRLVEAPDGVRLEALPVDALPGSPAAAEAAAAADKAAAAETQKVRAGDVVLDDIGRALDISRNAPGLPSTGAGSLLQNLPGSNAHNLQQTLQSVKSNVSFDRLQQMRAASPTGGALGSVTENEGKKLESAYGALEQSVDQPTFEYNLKRVANIYMDIVHGEGNGPPRYNIGGEGETDLKSKYGLE